MIEEMEGYWKVVDCVSEGSDIEVEAKDNVWWRNAESGGRLKQEENIEKQRGSQPQARKVSSEG